MCFLLFEPDYHVRTHARTTFLSKLLRHHIFYDLSISIRCMGALFERILLTTPSGHSLLMRMLEQPRNGWHYFFILRLRRDRRFISFCACVFFERYPMYDMGKCDGWDGRKGVLVNELGGLMELSCYATA
jgi:hypothetical protein